jgi:hypothetical protein
MPRSPRFARLGLLALLTVAGGLLILPLLSSGGTSRASVHGHDDLLADAPYRLAHAGDVAVTVVLVGALFVASIAVLSISGHLVGRYLRRTGPTRLTGPAGRWITRQRARRAPVTVEIVLGRDDHASPYEISKLFDGLIGQMRPRWYERLALGADTFTVTLLNDPAQRAFRFLLAVRADTLTGFEHRLRATYPDIRTRPYTAPFLPSAEPSRPTRRSPSVTSGWAVVRVKKGRRWMWSLQTTRDYEHSLVEALVATMAGSTAPCLISLALTPAPLLLERRAARQLRTHEHRANAEATVSPGDPGAGSIVEQRQIKGAVETVGRSLAFFDYRVAVPLDRPELGRQLVGVAQEARSEGTLKPRRLRIRRRLYITRINRSLPSLIPALRTGVLSSAELATLWHLPTLRVRGVGLQRSGSRQIAASPAISRDRHDMVMRDEHGPVGIRADDRRYGWALLGGQGAGKSSALLRHIGNTARDPQRALILVDPKVDLARDALHVMPPHRTVHYLDLGAPHVGFNPFTILRSRGVSPEVVADLFVSAIRETAGEGAVGPRSDQFLRSAIAAVCTVEQQPTLEQVHRMLDPDDPGYREWVVDQLADHPDAEFLADFWGRSFPARIATNARFVAEIMEAPRNKLSRFLAVPSLARLTSHPVPLDLPGIVDRGEIFILNGNKGAIGEENAVLVCQLLVLCVQKLLHQQQQLAKDARRRVALVIDEAHNLFTPSFATMLSEGRAAGVEVAAAFQYSGQIVDDRVRAGVKSLLQNISIFRLREFEDARAAAALAMDVFADTIRGDVEDARRLRIDPIDIVNQPNHRAINLWLAEGTPQHAFTATTLPIEPVLALTTRHSPAA